MGGNEGGDTRQPGGCRCQHPLASWAISGLLTDNEAVSQDGTGSTDKSTVARGGALWGGIDSTQSEAWARSGCVLAEAIV